MTLACRPSLRASLRCLHTTARRCNESSSSTSASPSPSSLGFGDYTGRTRKLPTIPIPASSQRNVLRSRAPKSTSNSQQTKASGNDNNGRKRQPERQKQVRQARSPVQAAVRQAQAKGQAVESASASASAPSGEDEFFADLATAAPRNRASGMKKVDMDFSDTPTPIQVKSRAKSRSSAGTSTRASDNRPRERTTRSKAPVVPEVEDRSPEGIFGRASLLFPIRRGAREAERSVWAENLEPTEARKAEVTRLAGSPAVYLPSTPVPNNLTGKQAPRASKMLATWLLSNNPSVSMRRAKGGEAIINSYLK